MPNTVRMIGKQELRYGSELIEYTLLKSNRKQLTIIVETDGKVHVHAPLDADLESINEKIQRKAGWILRQRYRFESYGPRMPPKTYTNGETHLYLGRQYRLKISVSDAPHVKLVGRFFEIDTRRRNDSSEIERQMQTWLRMHAMVLFQRYLDARLKHPSFRSLQVPSFKIRKMSHRWGSCTKGGVIVLNLMLIQASPICIDYVVTHELCHLIHYAHDTAFYRLLKRIMPDWEARKAKLEQYRF